MRKAITLSLCLAVFVLFGVPAQAQSLFAANAFAANAVSDAAIPSSGLAEPASAPPAAPAPVLEPSTPLSRIGVGVRLSSLGPGADVAFKLTRRMDIRGGVNYFTYSQSFNTSGINYGGSIKFESGEVHFDYFLWRSLHVSPGLLFSNGTLFGGTATVPGGQSFSINHNNYVSDPADPLNGIGALKFNTVAPSILLGIGNPIPQGKHHFAMRFEIGGAFRGTPNIGLNFAGSVCTAAFPPVCQSAAADSAFQTDVAAQVKKYNNDISFLQFYPIISLGFGFRL